MKDKLIIGGKTLKVTVNAAVPMVYRDTFGEDVFLIMNQAMQKLMKMAKLKSAIIAGEDVEIEDVNQEDFTSEQLRMFERLAYIFNKLGDEDCPDDITEWMMQFDSTRAIYDSIADIITLWNKDNSRSTDSKKNKDK